MTVISPYVNKNPIETKTAINTMMSQIHKIYRLKDELLLLRFIRLVGFYPSSLFYGFINELIQTKSGVFMLEGLAAYERISRNKEYIDGYKQIYQVFISLIDYIEVDSNLFETLIMLNYHSVLKHSKKLLSKIIIKLKNTFMINIQNNSGNKHTIMRILNYF